MYQEERICELEKAGFEIVARTSGDVVIMEDGYEDRFHVFPNGVYVRVDGIEVSFWETEVGSSMVQNGGYLLLSDLSEEAWLEVLEALRPKRWEVVQDQDGRLILNTDYGRRLQAETYYLHNT